MDKVDICICTFRRVSVVDTLRSVAAQDVAAGVIGAVIVADNDERPSAHDMVLEVGNELSLPIRYVHAPARNISVARNACLDAATAPLLAFLDDDEVASPGWLSALLATMAAEDAPIVLGPVRALYTADTPAWLSLADQHSTAPARRRDGTIDTGYSCNVLFRHAAVGDARFDPRLGRTGGEDDVFFNRLHRAGNRIAFAAEAWVEEPVPAHRARLGWLLRRSFRNGQTFGRIQGERGRGGVAVVTAVAKAAVCGAGAAATCWSQSRWRRAAVRGALHVGVVAQALGKSDLELY